MQRALSCHRKKQSSTFFFVMPIEIDSGVKSKAGIPFGRLQHFHRSKGLDQLVKVSWFTDLSHEELTSLSPRTSQ